MFSLFQKEPLVSTIAFGLIVGSFVFASNASAYEAKKVASATPSTITASASATEGARGAGVEEEKLLTKLKALDRKGVGIKPMLIELARIDFLYRHGDLTHAQPRLERLARTIKEHERIIKEKDAPPQYSQPYVAYVPPVSMLPNYSKNSLVPPPPPIALTSPVPNTFRWGQGSLYPQMQQAPQPRRTPEQARITAISKIAVHMRMEGISPEQIKAVFDGLDGTNSRNETLVTAVSQRELGGLAPAPGPFRLERFVMAKKIAYLSKHPRNADPVRMQQLVASYQQVEQAARSGGGKEQLIASVKGLEQALRMDDIIGGGVPAADPNAATAGDKTQTSDKSSVEPAKPVEQPKPPEQTQRQEPVDQ